MKRIFTLFLMLGVLFVQAFSQAPKAKEYNAGTVRTDTLILGGEAHTTMGGGAAASLHFPAPENPEGTVTYSYITSDVYAYLSGDDNPGSGYSEGDTLVFIHPKFTVRGIASLVTDGEVYGVTNLTVEANGYVPRGQYRLEEAGLGNGSGFSYIFGIEYVTAGAIHNGISFSDHRSGLRLSYVDILRRGSGFSVDDTLELIATDDGYIKGKVLDVDVLGGITSIDVIEGQHTVFDPDGINDMVWIDDAVFKIWYYPGSFYWLNTNNENRHTIDGEGNRLLSNDNRTFVTVGEKGIRLDIGGASEYRTGADNRIVLDAGQMNSFGEWTVYDGGSGWSVGDTLANIGGDYDCNLFVVEAEVDGAITQLALLDGEPVSWKEQTEITLSPFGDATGTSAVILYSPENDELGGDVGVRANRLRVDVREYAVRLRSPGGDVEIGRGEMSNYFQVLVTEEPLRTQAPFALGGTYGFYGGSIDFILDNATITSIKAWWDNDTENAGREVFNEVGGGVRMPLSLTGVSDTLSFALPTIPYTWEKSYAAYPVLWVLAEFSSGSVSYRANIWRTVNGTHRVFD